MGEQGNRSNLGGCGKRWSPLVDEITVATAGIRVDMGRSSGGNRCWSLGGHGKRQSSLVGEQAVTAGVWMDMGSGSGNRWELGGYGKRWLEKATVATAGIWVPADRPANSCDSRPISRQDRPEFGNTS